MNPPAKAVFVPPRPNLGPEPPLEPQWPTGLVLALALAIAVLLIIGLKNLGRKRPTKKANQPLAPASLPIDEPLVAWSISVREALAQRFGPTWLAKTTEEIAADPAIVEFLDPAKAERILALLGEADRAKFADSARSREDTDYLEELAALAEAAGARSTISGK